MNDLITGIDHPAIAAIDPRILAEWYCFHLGYTVHFDNVAENTLILKAADGSFLEIMSCDSSPRSMTTKAPGFAHLALRVKDLDAAAKRLSDAGIKVEPKKIKAQGGGFLRNFYDPEGNMLQFVQR
ncbi:MAG: VOC family protein [Thermoguttaceae bacterium]|nr:VOC family protein [Thermoguttaceae bacterium]